MSREMNKPNKLRMKIIKNTLLLGSVISASSLLISCDGSSGGGDDTGVQQRQVQVTFQATGPLAFAPMLFATHDGSFDFFDTGSTATAETELMAELGDVTDLLDTVPDSASSATTSAPTPVGGQFTVTLTLDEVNRFFTYSGMVLPSSDTFVGNNNPVQFDLVSLLAGSNGEPVTISVDRMYDAGTEVNNFLTSPGGPLVGAPAGVPTDGVDENTVITLATPNHFDDYLGSGAFDVTAINPNGAELARITIQFVE